MHVRPIGWAPGESWTPLCRGMRWSEADAGRAAVEGGSVAFEVIEFCEPSPEPGRPFPGTSEIVLGEFDIEADAIDVARARWKAMRASGTQDVMWWVVRVPGETLARWIADRSSPHEQILDLRTNALITLRS